MHYPKKRAYWFKREVGCVFCAINKWKVECSTIEKCKYSCTIFFQVSNLHSIWNDYFYYKVPKLSNLSVSQYYKNVLYHLLSKTVKSLRLFSNMFMSYNVHVELMVSFCSYSLSSVFKNIPGFWVSYNYFHS